MLSVSVAESGSDICEAEGGLPVKESPRVLVIVELVEVLDAELDLFGEALKDPVQVLLLIRPVASRQYLDTELAGELLPVLRLPELLIYLLT